MMAVKTDFSLGLSGISSEDVAEIAHRTGQKHVVVADTMSISSLIDVSKSAAKLGIEAYVGAAIRIVDDLTAKKDEGKVQNKQAYFIKAFARDEEGMRQIFKLLSLATDKDHSYYVPRVSLGEVCSILEPEHVVVTTGDFQGVFTGPKYGTRFGLLNACFGDSLFAELVAIPTPYFERANSNIVHTGLPPERHIVTFPTLCDEGGFERLRLNMAIQNRSDLNKAYTVSEPWFKDMTPHTDKGLLERVRETLDGMRVLSATVDPEPFKAALRAGNEAFLNAASYRWTKQPIALPSLAEDAPAAVLAACKAGILSRLTKSVFGYQPTKEQIRDEYVPRLKYELGILTDKGFCDYFLVVADLVQWAKSEGIQTGTGRGSVGGSLVAYLMGITDVDPLRFNLLFERFINPSRKDLPDADLDFMSTRREEIITYLEGKYGKDRVAGISNYGVLGSASAIKDVSRVHGLDLSGFAASKFIPAIHGQPVPLEQAREEVAEIQKFALTNPKVWKGALAVQGVMRSYGRHAAGVIVSGVPMIERAVVETDGAGRKVNWDLRTVEDQGLIKLDVLGLSTLDTLSRCVRYIKERHGKRIDLLAIPLDDAKTLEAFSAGDTVGIFQLEGGAARRILQDMARSSTLTFEDLVATNALNRPGPIDAGLPQTYIKRRNGEELISYPHPLLEKTLQDTFGVLTYQEQVQRMSMELCGFSGADSDSLRRAIGKKDAEKMAEYEERFVAGAVAGTISVELETGEVKVVHRMTKFRAVEDGVFYTVEEFYKSGLTPQWS